MARTGLEPLEYGRFRGILAGLTSSYLGRRAIDSLTPLRSRAEAEHMLDLVSRLVSRALAGAGLPPLEVPDLGPVFTRLARTGSVLGPEEFLELSLLLRAIDAARGVLEPVRENMPELWALAAPLPPLPHLARALESTFEPTGEIRDSASTDLRRIRRERERLREKLRGRLERMASGLGTPDAASVVTLREGRYVLSVPQTHKSQVKGLVQDRSASGQTLYVEPMDLVEDNNALREKDVEEREEIRRILVALTQAFSRERPELERAWHHLGYLDELRARARLGLRWGGQIPEFSDELRLSLVGARHPLLLESRGAAHDLKQAESDVVPLRMELTPEHRILLITGPNMGGKTVALKCIGLLCAMAQSGCLVPAAPGTTLPWLTTWVVDVGDEQSLEDDISTFGAHVRRWAEALEQASPQTLVLLDELGSGTDPAEGAVLAQSVLERLTERGGLGVVTTHLGALKAFAAATPGIQNASMVFDSESRRPTYTLLPGVPGDSHALDMARRLGFPDERVDRARDLLPQGERDVKELLEDLRREREALVVARRDAEVSLTRAREAESEAQGRLQRFLEDRAELRAKAARQAREILRRAETQAKETRSVERARGAVEDPAKRQALQAEARKERARLARLETRRRHASGSVPHSVAPGEVYWAESLEREVRIVRGGDTGGRALVEHGSLKVELPVASLRTVTSPAERPAGTNGSHPEEAAPPVVRRNVVGIPDSETVSPEVDLRGMRAEEARSALEQAMDRALLASLRELRVIHGKGTGVLQTVVAEYCRTQPAVKSFRLGEGHEGGSGVTVIRLED